MKNSALSAFSAVGFFKPSHFLPYLWPPDHLPTSPSHVIITRMDDPLAARARRRLTLIAITLSTIPCYCIGWVAMTLAPGPQTATPTPMLTSASETPTLSGSFTPTLSPTPSFLTVTATLSLTPTESLTPTISPTPFLPPTLTFTSTPTWTPSFTPTPTFTPSPTPTFTPSPTATPTFTPTATPTPTSTFSDGNFNPP